MTLSEEIEQRITGRPDSHVPGRTLARLLGRPDADGKRPAFNLGMHWGMGTVMGVLRGLMANAGLRGPWSSAMFGVNRQTADQIAENATGVGAPPWTWPRDELAIDLFHKSVYAYATGAVADALVGRRGPGPGERHAQLRPGRRHDVGPVPAGVR
jgi:hypothetical protein